MTTNLQKAVSLLRPVPDFPKSGILFWDINPVLRDIETLRFIADHLADYWKGANVDIVAGFDSRGFLFGPMVADRLNVGFTMIRKKGKLPPPTVLEEYDLEYGSNAIEMVDDDSLKGKNVLLIDDLLATGGTAAAGIALVKKLGGLPVGFTSVIELVDLQGQQLLNIPSYSPILRKGDEWAYGKVKLAA